MNSAPAKNIDVVVLCGGLGKRLAPITKNIPKPMVRVKNKPFLDIIITRISSYGYRRFILCTGYKAKVIEDYCRNKYKNSKLEIVFSREAQPLGTGGALKSSQAIIKSNIFLVLNGDCFCEIGLKKFLSFHLKKKAGVSMALTKSNKAAEVGWVTLNDKHEITNFSEKNNKYKSNYINTGIYLFHKKVFSMMPDKTKFSLEYDLFPKLVNKCIYGYIIHGDFIDIGTCENLKKAKRFFKDIEI